MLLKFHKQVCRLPPTCLWILSKWALMHSGRMSPRQIWLTVPLSRQTFHNKVAFREKLRQCVCLQWRLALTLRSKMGTTKIPVELSSSFVHLFRSTFRSLKPHEWLQLPTICSVKSREIFIWAHSIVFVSWTMILVKPCIFDYNSQ